MWQSVLVRQHRSDPSLTISRHEFDDSLEIVTRKTLPFEDLSHFFSLALRRHLDMTILDLFQPPPIIKFGPGPKIVTRSHRKAVGKQVGKSERKNYPL
jgi:hypothetical protein